jgi:hypothetical protein
MKTIADVVRDFNGVWPNNVPSIYFRGFFIYRKEFEQEADRLRNKPIFADHPDAKCFVQTPAGNWHKNVKTSEVVADEEAQDWCPKKSIGLDPGWVHIGTGEMLGDWRDTLEARPEQENNKLDRVLDELEKNAHRLSDALSAASKPAQETIKDWADKETDQPEWTPGKTLPPAGTICEIAHKAQGKFGWCKIRFMGDRLCVVDLKSHSEQHYYLSSVDFRPPKSERERAIEAALKVCPYPGSHSTRADIGAIYDAGMLKLPEVDGE